MQNLATVPALLEHVLHQVAGLRAKRYDRSGTPWEAPLPLNVGAFDDGNELWTVLVDTVQLAADRLDLTPPDAASVGWRAEHGLTIGLPKGITPALARHDATTLTRWLDALNLHDDDAWMLEPLDGCVRKISSRYPLRDRATRARGAACPDDGAELLIRPPRHLGDPQLIVCTRCAATFTEDQTEEIRRWHAAVQAQAALVERGRKVRAHLTSKYGPAA